MALSVFSIFEVRPATGSSGNGCGFDPSQTAGMFTDGAATSATGTAPVFTSASYNFVAGDVNAKVYIASGTNWIPGWYTIASVAANAATLNATAGQAVLKPGTGGLSTVNGCATTASPTGSTWSIDYSQQSSAQISYTDLVIGATTTQATSVANPFGAQLVGNIYQVNSGTGFTPGFYCLKSVSALTGTFDRSLGTTASTGGHAALGGAVASLVTLFTGSSGTQVPVSGNIVWMTGSQTITTTITLFGDGGNYRQISLRGYGTYRGDGTHATITTSTNSVHGFTLSNLIGFNFQWLSITCSAGTPGSGIFCGSNNSEQISVENCTFTGWNVGINGNYGAGYLIFGLYIINCKIASCTADGVENGGSTFAFGSWFHANGADGIASDVAQTGLLACYGCVSDGNTGNGYNASDTSATRSAVFVNCVAYNNGAAGIFAVAGAGVQLATLINCILYDNTTYGLLINGIAAGSATPTVNLQYNNAFGANGTAPRNSGAPVGVGDITLSGNPFTSASTGDFSLNATAGAGAACTGTGWQSTIV